MGALAERINKLINMLESKIADALTTVEAVEWSKEISGLIQEVRVLESAAESKLDADSYLVLELHKTLLIARQEYWSSSHITQQLEYILQRRNKDPAKEFQRKLTNYVRERKNSSRKQKESDLWKP